MKERELFGNTLKAVLAAGLLTAGCEVASRPTPIRSPFPTESKPAEIVPTPTPGVEEKPRRILPAVTPESRTGEFRWLNITSIGISELILTRGRDNPGQGFYVSAINPMRLRGLLEERKDYVSDMNFENSLRLIVSISKGENKDSFVVQANIGRSGEEEFKDTKKFEMVGVKDSSIIMVLSWLNWKLGDINWWEQGSLYKDKEKGYRDKF